MHTLPSPLSRHLAAPCLALLLVTACGGGSGTSDAFSSEELEDGSLQTQINATDKEAWVYVDLDRADTLVVSEADAGWDLAFKRTVIKLHNDALVAIAVLDDRTFEEVDGSPTADKFFNDASDEEDDLAFSQERGWYSYNLLKHEVSPRTPRVYVVRSSEGTLYKIAFTDYYDDGEGGYPAFRWGRVDGKKVITDGPKEPCDVEATITRAIGDFDTPSMGTLTKDVSPEGVVSATLDASLGGAEQAAESSYLYLDLERGELVALSDQQAREDKGWHVAFKRSELRANSADSGPGEVFVARLDGTAFESAPAQAPAMDDMRWRDDDFVNASCEVKTFGLDFIETAFGQWYDYDVENHTLSVVPDVTYYVQDRARQASYTFSIDGYEEGVYTLRWQKR